MSEIVLSVKDLVVAFDGANGNRKVVVDGVSFEVKQGEVLGILGESGSGKTMSTQSVLGLIDGEPGVMGGKIEFYPHAGPKIDLLASLQDFIKDDQKSNRAWQKHTYQQMKALWGSGMTAIFQNPKKSLDPLMRVGDQVKESIISRDLRLNQTIKSQEEYHAQVIEILKQVQLREPERVYLSFPHELSGGMCQRIMIAVAIAAQPKLLIADEPTTGLDATVRAEVLAILKQVIVDRGNAMLYISHDIREILYLTEHVIVMRHGKIIERAKTVDLINGVGERHPYTQTLLEASGLVDTGDASQSQTSSSQSQTDQSHEQITHKQAPLILKAKNLQKTYQVSSHQTIALDHVDLEIRQGEVLALIGESGSGKTTLGKAILRLLSLDAGEVWFDGIDLLKLSGSTLREARKSFQMIFQNQQANLHPKMSVFEMLEESLLLHQPNLDIEQRKVQIKKLLDQVGLYQHENRYVASLSGGEQRRVGLARIFATKPKLVVADEPTSGLDAAIKLQTIDLLAQLKSEDLSYLLISHDLGLVKKIADRMIVMLRGRIIEVLPMSELYTYAHHPYTQRLLAATELGSHEQTQKTGGSVEDTTHSKGCVYANTCPLAKEKGILTKCQTVRPELKSIGQHQIACWGRTQDEII